MTWLMELFDYLTDLVNTNSNYLFSSARYIPWCFVFEYSINFTSIHLFFGRLLFIIADKK